MTYTYDENLYSDFYKEAHGFRPGEYAIGLWKEMTPDQKQKEWDNLTAEMEAVAARTKSKREEAVLKFECEVESNISAGAATREEAVAWIVEELGRDKSQLDPGYICYLLGLPFSYEKEFVNLVNVA